MVIPSYWKRPRVLIVGCGDIGQRVAEKLLRHHTVLGLCRRPEAAAGLRAAGIRPVPGDLDRRQSLKRLGGLARQVLHFAPPPAEGGDDARTRRLLAALGRRGPRGRARPPKPAIVTSGRLLYISTSGVYGDCAGAPAPETRPVRPQSDRARRRAAAERRIRRLGRGGRWSTAILRVPGIHGPARLPLARLRGGLPVMRPDEDSWGNHVDADDLAAAVVHLLRAPTSQRVYNVCDSQPLPMGTYLNRLAAALGLPPLPEVSREEAERQLPPGLWSFQRESRRLPNRRLLRETRWRPAVDTVDRLIERIRRPD